MKQTVDNYLSMWLSIRRAGLAPSTALGYESIIKLHISPLIGALGLSDLSAADVMRCLAPLCSDGHTRAAQLTLITLRAALSDAVHMGLISYSPAAAVRLPRHESASPRYWSLDVMRQFLTSQSTSPYYALWQLALICGLRRGEICGLRWSDVDLTSGRIHIRNQRLRIKGKIIDCAPKSAAGRRDLDLPGSVLASLRALKRSQGLSSPYVCILSPDGLRSAFLRACGAAQVPPINLHGLRHSMASAAVSLGVDIKVLQGLLGHAHYSTTADFYAHVDTEAKASALMQLDTSAHDWKSCVR